MLLAIDWRAGEDSCGKSGTGETPQERKRRGGSAAARGKRSHARKSTAVSQAIYASSFIQYIHLQRGEVLMSQSLV
ncbi:hypothetical protein IHQ11_14750 [Priestia megaterium]|uniref:hypothetical protein n=1 Tax=Priestia megaterium TaxID=1404 RepID=UPI001B3A52D8|nr:hypothetical protein [Priestia megaterium]MBQ4867758.1 hypothetical protein [Priestia megaterium]MEB2274260.1 hypothetical protein [Bacillus sp. ILBB4]